MDIVGLLLTLLFGIAFGYLSRLLPPLSGGALKPPVKPVEATHWERVPNARHPSLDEWIVTVEFSDGREVRFRGDATSWNFFPSGHDAGTTMELWLLGRWKAHLWSLQDKEER